MRAMEVGSRRRREIPGPRQAPGVDGRSVESGALNALFVPAPPSRLRWRNVVVATVAVTAGTAVGLARTGGAGALDTITFEDSKHFLSDALNHPALSNFTRPLAGYYVLAPRLLAEIAACFPLRWAAPVLTAEAAVTTACLALIVYVAGSSQLRTPPLRLLAAAPMVVLPASQGPGTSVDNNVATLQFFLLYTLFWVLLWVPSSRSGRIVAAAVAGVTAFTSMLSVLFLPLALARLLVRRDRGGATSTALIAAGFLANTGALALGATARPDLVGSRWDVAWALQRLNRALPRLIVGQSWSTQFNDYGHGKPATHNFTPGAYIAAPPGWVVATWLVLGTVLLVAACRFTDPFWTLAGIAAGYAAMMFCVAAMSLGIPEPRYTVAPALLMTAAVAVLLRPRIGGGARTLRYAPVALYAVVLAAICVLNFHTADYRSVSPRWSGLVEEARHACTSHPELGVAVVTTSPPNWPAYLPCSRLRH